MVGVIVREPQSVNRAHLGSEQLEAQFRWRVDEESTPGQLDERTVASAMVPGVS